MKETLHYVKASTRYKREHKPDYGKEKIEILYEDKDIVVVNKDSGLLSVPYPGSKARTAVELLEKIMRKNGTFAENHRPFVVHRLDRDTSGVMMFALNERVQKKIMSAWKTMVTERLYRAVAENPRRHHPELPDSGLIDEPLAKNACHQGYVPKKIDSSVEICEARTNFTVILRGRTHTLFELSLDTGKKNQIRAHLASKHYPLAGDENYRARTDPFHRLALHARTLAFVHPATGEKLRFEIPEPENWAEYVQKGDPHPVPPVWAEEKKSIDVYNARVENIKGSGHSLRKQARKMDFISRGKSGIR
ncbi:RluA family pseudouridine synthase [Treponema sp.]|uniref:RluA family pseudouridine synthase n=1 Tax=Treponema sp. TaxID=166 RepID=UPI003F0CBEDD